RSDDLVISITGDGGLQMNMQELMLLQAYDLPVIVLIFNNAALGMVRQWQESFYEERYSESLLEANPDFDKMAESYGIHGIKVESDAEAEEALKEIIDYDGPVVADLRIIKKEKVYPMIAPGSGINDLIEVTK